MHDKVHTSIHGVMYPPMFDCVPPVTLLDAFNTEEQKVYFYFFKTRTLQSRGVVTLFHLFTIAMYGRNCFDM